MTLFSLILSCSPLSVSFYVVFAHQLPFKVSWSEILFRGEAAADESDTAVELLIDLLHHIHSRTQDTQLHTGPVTPKTQVNTDHFILKTTPPSLLQSTTFSRILSLFIKEKKLI